MTRRRNQTASTRSALYKTARFLGDYQAARSGHMGARIRPRVIGRLLSRLIP